MTDRTDFIQRLIKQKPEQYLRTITVKINDEVTHVGLFKCEVCNKPIADAQYNFARCCASCDTNHDNSDWVIEKPEPQEFENRLEFGGEQI